MHGSSFTPRIFLSLGFILTPVLLPAPLQMSPPAPGPRAPAPVSDRLHSQLESGPLAHKELSCLQCQSHAGKDHLGALMGS